MSRSKKLVFFGSGPVGRATLDGLAAKGFMFEAIITKPWPKEHRSQMPVLDFAAKKVIRAYTPENKQELSDLFNRVKFTSELGLVVDYGLIIGRGVIDSFRLGILNSHFSLLPELRGADPISFAILNGLDRTGVSLMLINEKLDQGQLIAQQTVQLSPDITTSSLTKKLVNLSNKLLVKYIPLYTEGRVKPHRQPARPATYSRRLTKEDGVIDLNKPAEQLEREVRAFDEWPKSTAELFGRRIVVTKARTVDSPDTGPLVLKANPGYLEIVELIAPSGRRMSGADFIRGYGKEQKQ